jgi:flagellar basal-body rod modification protein FlgD
VNTVNSLGVNASSASDTAANKSVASGAADLSDRFLKLLVTQMKNQDPLNPLDNAQVTSQLAQISTVTGIDKLNATLQALSASQSLDTAAMIGRGVLAPGSELDLKNGVAIGGVDLPQAVDKLVVSIKDSSGVEVRSIDMGPKPAGTSEFFWDGLTNTGTSASNGTYHYSVRAEQGGKSIASNPLQFGIVSSVVPGSKGQAPILRIDGLGEVDLSSIKLIYQ